MNKNTHSSGARACLAEATKRRRRVRRCEGATVRRCDGAIAYVMSGFSRTAAVLAILSLAASATAQDAQKGPRPGEVETAPIKCWWKTDTTAIRIGERFTVTLTCGVIETSSLKVVAGTNQLDPGAVQLTPFEVVSGVRRQDVVAPPWKYFQYQYPGPAAERRVLWPGRQSSSVAGDLQHRGGRREGRARPRPELHPATASRPRDVARAQRCERYPRCVDRGVRSDRVAPFPLDQCHGCRRHPARLLGGASGARGRARARKRAAAPARRGEAGGAVDGTECMCAGALEAEVGCGQRLDGRRTSLVAR